MPPKQSRMTANPVKPSRYRPGKPLAEEAPSSSEDEDDDADDSANDHKQQPPAPQSHRPPPKVSSFPTDAAKKVTTNLKNVDLGQRRRAAEAQEKAEREQAWREQQRQEREAGFVTESESDDEEESDDQHISKSSARPPQQPAIQRPTRPASDSDDGSDSDSDSGSGSGSGSDTSSSSSANPRKQLRPVFIPKNQRNANPATSTAATEAAATTAKQEAEAARRAAQTDALVQERTELDARARAAGKKSWDDDSPDDEGQVDDTDGLDPELEHAQWVARELSRLKRSRAALEAREAEIAEVERRKALTTPEREAEDAAHIEQQNEDRKQRGKAAFMQRYHHKGAFYHDEDTDEAGLLQRDLMGATYESHQGMKEALPQYLQVRDETMIGRKGRTKYRDLKSEDTGRWGDFARDKRRPGGGSSFGQDERFRPDRDTQGPSGANASSLGERKRPHIEDTGRSRVDDSAKRPRRDEQAS